MEVELGAPMFRAVVVSVHSSDECIELQVRYFRHRFWDDERKKFAVTVKNSTSQYWQEKYVAAEKLRPGDEIFVDPYGEEWCKPAYRNCFKRCLNLLFG